MNTRHDRDFSPNSLKLMITTEGSLAVPGIKLYYKAVVIKTIWYWLRDRRDDQCRLGVSDLSKTVYDKPKESNF